MALNDSFFEKITVSDTVESPKYRQLAMEIERLIRNGELLPNARLPGEYDFLEALTLSRSTIRKAFEELEAKGLVYRRQGQGTFIGSRPESQADIPRPTAARGGTIGVLVPNMTNEIYPQIVHGIEETAQRYGACVFVGNTGGHREREYQLLQQMFDRDINGLLVEPTHSGLLTDQSRTIQLLRDIRLPYVLFNNDIPSLDCSKVLLDDIGGGYTATRHLIAFGHRRIVYIYKSAVKAATDRLIGYKKALAEYNIPWDPELVFTYTEEDEKYFPGYEITKRILGADCPQFTAIFYFNDDLALQGVQAIDELGLQLPRDLSVIGFDDILRSRMGRIPLSTMDHPQGLMGRWAADLLFDQLANPDRHIHRQLMIQPGLIPRSSVGAPSVHGG